MRTADMHALLRKRYPPDAWALMWEVGDATGMRHTRWADAVAMSLWPTHGLLLHGMEIKVSRSDWVRELQNPAKAEAVAQYCDRWWLVVSDKAFVKPGELPECWGLMAPNAKGNLQVVTPAKELKPKPLTREFLASLLRAAAKPAVKADSASISRAVQEAVAKSDETMQRLNETVSHKLAALTKQLLDFERFSGLTISQARYGWTQYEAKQIGEKVKEVLSGVHDRDRAALERMLETAQEVAKRLETHLKGEPRGPTTSGSDEEEVG